MTMVVRMWGREAVLVVVFCCKLTPSFRAQVALLLMVARVVPRVERGEVVVVGVFLFCVVLKEVSAVMFPV